MSVEVAIPVPERINWEERSVLCEGLHTFFGVADYESDRQRALAKIFMQEGVHAVMYEHERT